MVSCKTVTEFLGMHYDMYQDLIREIMNIYFEIDRKISIFQLSTGLRCPPGCGSCCESKNVEATILECLPLADHIYRRKEAESVLASVDRKVIENDRRCVLFKLDERIAASGRCAYYGFRPLVCRLFGFAARRDKFGKQEICLCRVVKGNNHELIEKLPEAGDAMSNAPISHDSFMRIASLHPGLGFKLFPINIALKNALEYLYWKHPRDIGYRNRKAA